MDPIEQEIDAINYGCTRIVDNRFKVSFWAERYDLSTRKELIGMNLIREQVIKKINGRK